MQLVIIIIYSVAIIPALGARAASKKGKDHMKQKLRPLAFAVMAAGIIAAAPVAAGEMPVFSVELKDGVVTPNRLQVPAGQTFKIKLRNAGAGPAEFESRRLRKEKLLAPGAESFVVIRRLSAGQYEFFDDFYASLDTAHGTIVAK